MNGCVGSIAKTTRARRHHRETRSRCVGEPEIALRISAVAACCSRASANSRARKLTCSCKSASEELRRRTVVGAVLRFGLVVLRCSRFERFRLTVPRRPTCPSRQQTALTYHIVKLAVQHSKLGRRLAGLGSTPGFSPRIGQR